MGYYYRRPPRRSRNPRLDFALTAIVLALLLMMVVVFLFVYHDFPLRVS